MLHLFTQYNNTFITIPTAGSEGREREGEERRVGGKVDIIATYMKIASLSTIEAGILNLRP